MTRRIRDPQSRDERNSAVNRRMGDGTMGGREWMATRRRAFGRAGDVNRNAQPSVYGEWILWAGDVTIEGAGTDLMQLAALTIVEQAGWASVAAPGHQPVAQIDGPYAFDLFVRFKDGESAGAAVNLLVGDVPYTPQLEDGGSWNEWQGTRGFYATPNQGVGMQVAPNDGEDHPAEVRLGLAFFDPTPHPLVNEEVPAEGAIFWAGGQYADGAWFYPVWSLAAGATEWEQHPAPTNVDNGWNGAVQAGASGGDGSLVVADQSGYMHRTTVVPPSTTSDWVEVFDADPAGYPLLAMAGDGTKMLALEVANPGPARLWESDDDGATWALQTTFGDTCDYIVHNGFNRFAVLGSHTSKSGGSPYGSLRVSADGASWTVVTMPNITDGKYAVAVGSDPDVIVLSQVNQVTDPDTNDGYLTLNGGASWSPVSLGIGDGNDEGTRHAFTDSQGRVCLVGTDNQVYVHTGGGSWAAGVALPAYGGAVERVATAKSGSGAVAVANYQEVVDVSDDDGDTWTQTDFDVQNTANTQLYAMWGSP